jgi:hypothetical protein
VNPRYRWMHAFLDVPADLADRAAGFWAAATGSRIGAPWPDHPEFRSLEPPTGTRYLHVQRHDGPPRLHLDLDTPDVDAETARLVELGATAHDRHRWWQVLTSPGGQPFCLVRQDAPRSRPGPVRWPGGHRSRVAQLVLDIPAAVHPAECAFWRAATGWPERTGRRTEFRWLDPPPESPLQLLLHRLGVDDPGTAVRAHLDIGTDDLDAEVRRVVRLGAAVADEHGRWVALRDPVGMPFCVTPVPPA